MIYHKFADLYWVLKSASDIFIPYYVIRRSNPSYGIIGKFYHNLYSANDPASFFINNKTMILFKDRSFDYD